MCVRVYNKDTKEDTDTPTGFADMLGISAKDLPVDNALGQLIPESCLCQVNIEKACKLYGYDYIEDEDFSIAIAKKSPESSIQDILKHR
jgi:hypothetical protein